MSTLAFVLFWVVVTLGLLFVAMSGGVRGRRQARAGGAGRGAKVSYGVFAVTLLVLGIVVPGLVIAGDRERDSVPEAGISSLTDQEERGRKLFAEQCRQCHTLQAAAASAVVGPNLDALRPTYGLTLDAIRNGRARGNGAMAADLVTGTDAEAVAAFVARAVGQEDSIGEPPPESAQGEDEGVEEEPGGSGE